jgi:hypothetical protein
MDGWGTLKASVGIGVILLNDAGLLRLYIVREEC